MTSERDLTSKTKSSSKENVLLEVRNLQMHFKTGTKGIVFGIGAVKQTVQAVDGSPRQVMTSSTPTRGTTPTAPPRTAV